MGVVEEDEEERKLLNRKMGRSSRQKQRILIESGWAERQRRRRLVSDGWASRGAPLAGLPCMATTAPACLNRSSRWPCPVSLALLRNVATPRLSLPDDDPTTSATPAAAVLVRAQGDLATAVEALRLVLHWLAARIRHSLFWDCLTLLTLAGIGATGCQTRFLFSPILTLLLLRSLTHVFVSFSQGSA